jgi:hypothetical protein
MLAALEQWRYLTPDHSCRQLRALPHMPGVLQDD